MILYKYVGYDAGMKILQNNTVGFRQPFLFNDPFELLASYPGPQGNPFGEIRNWAKRQIWAENYGVLSLTRSHLNPLMWAHYSNEHKGFVIGIDVGIDIFTSEEKNLIPVQFGNVIYTESKPIYEFLGKFGEPISIGSTYHFVPSQFEKLQRVFLYKPMCWSYEEEVRIVKCINGVKEGKLVISGEFEVIQVNGSDLFVLKLPEDAVEEIYLGIRNPVRKDQECKKQFFEVVTNKHPNAKIFGCFTGSESWGIEHRLIENV
jgi:hypothetical protein